ncbi:MAG: hypothetical protein Q8J89_13500 [Caulobacter sp.]|nr:hypothetical protein [Caulobacter sp.]
MNDKANPPAATGLAALDASIQRGLSDADDGRVHDLVDVDAAVTAMQTSGVKAGQEDCRGGRRPVARTPLASPAPRTSNQPRHEECPRSKNIAIANGVVGILASCNGR